MLSARRVSSVPPCWTWLLYESIYSFIQADDSHLLIIYLIHQSENSDVFGGCLCWAVCLCAGWQMMGAVSSSWATWEACLWVHNRAVVPLVIGNNSPSSPGSGVVNCGLEGNPPRGPTAGAVCATDVLSETGNEWEKEAETTLCCQTTALIEVWAGSRRCSVSHQQQNKGVLSLQNFLQTVFTGHNAISVTVPQGLKLHTFSLWAKRKIEEVGVWSNNSGLDWQSL